MQAVNIFIFAIFDLSEFTNNILIKISLLTKVFPLLLKNQENKTFRCLDTEQSTFTSFATSGVVYNDFLLEEDNI